MIYNFSVIFDHIYEVNFSHAELLVELLFGKLILIYTTTVISPVILKKNILKLFIYLSDFTSVLWYCLPNVNIIFLRANISFHPLEHQVKCLKRS